MEKTKMKSKLSPKTKKLNVIKTFLLIGLVAAVCVLIYPSFADSLTDIEQIMSIGGYVNSITDLTEQEISQIKLDAYEYNDKIYREQQMTPFIYRGASVESDEYRQILRVSDINDVMATIDIPTIDLYVPITHGTRSEDLAYRAGHMYGTSMPINCNNMHAVITAHTGLETADLFTHIVDLKIGDEVQIHVLDEIDVYKVCEINVVEPLDASAYLQVEPGRRLITLFTCTPYGINSHRLLVKCEFDRQIAPAPVEGMKEDVHNRNVKAMIITILWILLPLALLIIGLVLIWKRKKKKQKKNNKTSGDKDSKAVTEHPNKSTPKESTDTNSNT